MFLGLGSNLVETRGSNYELGARPVKLAATSISSA